MKGWYVYIIECRNNILYTGITNDLKKRINEHNSGEGAKFTKGRIPVKLRYSAKCKSRSEALKCEIKIKSLSKIQKLDIILRK